MIVPEFWKNETPAVDPKDNTIDCGDLDLSDDTHRQTLRDKMRDIFDRTGFVVVTNTGLTSMVDMQNIAKFIVEAPMTYTGGANKRNGIVENVYETGAPKEAHLQYHHELAYLSKSTKMLGFCCDYAVNNKGWTFVSDQVGLTEAFLKTDLGQKLKEKGLCYIRHMTDEAAYVNADESGVYNHWQKSFGTSDVEEVEKLCKERGLVCEWGPDPTGRPGRCLTTKFYASAYEYCPATDKNIMFSSIADHYLWFDTWPGLRDIPTHLRPLQMKFGDDTDINEDELRAWIDIYDQFGVPIKWKAGDIAVICNWRWAHGRPAYTLEEGERRNLGVLLGETFDRVGPLEGKW
mmetsp:Transcript_12127/g.18311  ORF Transcript_12127/g.18311 Transcript_12127/m.18311 type:complete len:347 (+) Transcript_12127:147-1187(+)|eukprot:CAMPEP_0185023886 /NCGR_PEP_ID=MMETSP1103-20130426/6502_1 /TAXON_ID=36769 /ORGANISM="Paraphysomonas bandaiensis, Strain Caron Lab Isolate" /LENGTH=346 /DNA_ID=CAMNT_0027556675 /DNA_START=120 /DNA_END=1160 /DNA_ORIENTATION=+